MRRAINLTLTTCLKEGFNRFILENEKNEEVFQIYGTKFGYENSA